jgi:hypothetical protein
MATLEGSDVAVEHNNAAAREEKFAETSLRDALEGIHKAAATRVTAIGVFTALVTGASAGAALSRSYGLFALCLAFLSALLIIEYFQRNALLSYYYRYIQIATEFYQRNDDYTWLAGFAPPKLLEEFAEIVSNNGFSEKVRGERMRQCMRPWKYPQFALFLIALIAGYSYLIYYAKYCAAWPLLPAVAP